MGVIGPMIGVIAVFAMIVFFAAVKVVQEYERGWSSGSAGWSDRAGRD